MKKAASFEAAFLEFANRKSQIRDFSRYPLVLLRTGRRRCGGGAILHVLRVILDERLQIAVAEASVEIVVLHFRVGLIQVPMVNIETIDRAHDSGAVTA